jgi:lipopolysaccharide export system protein LptA
LNEEGGGIKKITALDNVVIVHDQKQGRGEKAVFNVKKDTIILTGNPVLIAKDQGKTEGIKLTFYLADGKIVIENKDRERSVTVIKS